MYDPCCVPRADRELLRRRSECAHLAALRRSGWRPAADSDWISPHGQRCDFALARPIPMKESK